jgi:hypothetical protein
MPFVTAERAASGANSPCVKEEFVTDESSLETDIKENDGGLQGWLTVAGSSLVYFSAFGIVNSFGFFQDLYSNKYLTSTPAPTIAFIGTIQITLLNALAAPAGSLFDYYGLKVGEDLHLILNYERACS